VSQFSGNNTPSTIHRAQFTAPSQFITGTIHRSTTHCGTIHRRHNSLRTIHQAQFIAKKIKIRLDEFLILVDDC
jgi:hypothetical protein